MWYRINAWRRWFHHCFRFAFFTTVNRCLIVRGGRKSVLCHYQRVGNCTVVEHYANVIYVAKLTCCYFYTGQPFDCSTIWNLTHRFSNEYSEPNLIERTCFSRLLILSLDSMFGVSTTTLLSFLLITWKPPSLHVHRATAKMLLVLRTFVECDYLSSWDK